MLSVLCRCKNGLQAIFLVIILITLLGFGSTLNATAAYGKITSIRHNSATCSITAQPTSQSVLVVLLDRSGSLHGSDSDGYSTSVTKALADLWPGIMIVIPFGDPLLIDRNSNVPVLPIYKATLSDPTQRDTLKENVQNYPIIGGTPLAPAMRKAIQELQNPPQGSRVIIITDGGPSPTTTFPKETYQDQRTQIETKLIGNFSQQCLPVSAFGLQTLPDADTLLGEIAHGTGGTYTKVQSPGELALQVITLYAQWRHLSFTKEPKNLTDRTYHVDINELAREANIVTFHTTGYTPIVTGPGGQPVQTIPNTDNHYEITSISSSQIAPGTYKVDMGDDPAAQVYALVDSKLQVGINTPSTTTTVYAGQPIKIEASLLNGNARFTPKKQAALNAFITFTANGQQPITDEVNLVQQLDQDKDTFIGYTPAYKQTGQVQITVRASYDNTDRESTVIIQLAPPPCNKGFVQCLWEEHQQLVLAVGIPGGLLVLLLIGLFIWYSIWRKLPAPYGYLVKANNEYNALALDTHRPWLAHFFSKSVITMQELAQHPQGITVAASLLDEPLAFVATDTAISLRMMQGTSSTVSVMTDAGEQKFSETQREIPLGSRSEIYRNGIPTVIFQQMMPRTLAVSLLH